MGRNGTLEPPFGCLARGARRRGRRAEWPAEAPPDGTKITIAKIFYRCVRVLSSEHFAFQHFMSSAEHANGKKFSRKNALKAPQQNSRPSRCDPETEVFRRIWPAFPGRWKMSGAGCGVPQVAVLRSLFHTSFKPALALSKTRFGSRASSGLNRVWIGSRAIPKDVWNNEAYWQTCAKDARSTGLGVPRPVAPGAKDARRSTGLGVPRPVAPGAKDARRSTGLGIPRPVAPGGRFIAKLFGSVKALAPAWWQHGGWRAAESQCCAGEAGSRPG